MRIVAVSPADVGLWKSRLTWHFESFCRSGDFAPEELWADVEDARRQLWVVTDSKVKAAVLTKIEPGKRKAVVFTHCAGEDRETWQHIWPAIRPWAKEAGCERVVMVTRPGWERLIPLRKTHVILEGEI